MWLKNLKNINSLNISISEYKFRKSKSLSLSRKNSPRYIKSSNSYDIFSPNKFEKSDNDEFKEAKLFLEKNINLKKFINSKKEEILHKFVLSKNNFKDLKEKLAKNIYKQFFNKYKHNSLIPIKILNEVVPYQIDEREINEKEEEMIEKNKYIKINGKSIQINNKYETDEDKDKESNHIIKEDLQENIINSDANEFWKDLGYDFFELLGMNKEYNIINNNKIKNKNTPEQNWKKLSSHLKRKFGINLFQTIGNILKVKNVISKDNLDEIDLKEKIKYYKILTCEYNEKIIKFLSKNDDNENKIKDKIKKKTK